MSGFDINALFQQAQQLQEDLRKAQDELGKKEVIGTAGGGMVIVTCTGKGDFLKVQIDKAAVDPKDVGMLEDLVLAACNGALANVRLLQQSAAGPLAGLQGMMPGMMK